MALKINYKVDASEGNRKYQISTNAQGKPEIVDVTICSQEGGLFKPGDINAITTEINRMTREVKLTSLAANWSDSAPYTQTVSAPGLEEIGKVQMMSATEFTTAVATVYTWDKMGVLTKAGITGNGEAIFYCPEKKPTSGFSIKLMGVSVNE